MNRITMMAAVAVCVGMAGSAMANPWYVRGDFNGWGEQEAVETGLGTGVFVANITGLDANEVSEFKIASPGWAESFPAANSKFQASGTGEVTITFDTNSAGDGWSPDTNRISINPAYPFTTLTAVGNWQSWNPGGPNTLNDQGGGIWSTSVILPTEYPSYELKVLRNATWAGVPHFGADGQGMNTAIYYFGTSAPDEELTFSVNVNNNTMKVELLSSVAGWTMIEY